MAVRTWRGQGPIGVIARWHDAHGGVKGSVLDGAGSSAACDRREDLVGVRVRVRARARTRARARARARARVMARVRVRVRVRIKV